MPVAYRKIFTDCTEEQLLSMTREEACLNLNDKQRKFCEVFVGNFNGKIAAKKAGYSVGAAHSVGWRLRNNPDVARYLAWLKVRVANEYHIKALDIVDQYARIAFADINDFVEIKDGRVKLIDGAQTDGQIIRKVTKGRDGLTVELYDKMPALAKLELYFETMPKDWKQKIEERKLELMKERLELDRLRLSGGEEIEDDGFMEALKGTAQQIWIEGEE